MINKYTNKQRGLLAVIMAMVMVFAGAAFVAAEVDADDTLKTYYVSSSAVEEGADGTEAKPFKTFGAVNTAAQNASISAYKVVLLSNMEWTTSDSITMDVTIDGGSEFTINLKTAMTVPVGKTLTVQNCTINSVEDVAGSGYDNQILVNGAGAKVITNSCTFTYDSVITDPHAVNVSNGSGKFTNTNFSNSKVTYVSSATYMTFTDCQNVYINTGKSVGIKALTTGVTTYDAENIYIDSETTISSFKVHQGVTITIDVGMNLKAGKILVKDDSKDTGTITGSGSITGTIALYEPGIDGNDKGKVNVSDVTFIGLNSIDSNVEVAVSGADVGPKSTLNVAGTVTGNLENKGTIVNNGSTTMGVNYGIIENNKTIGLTTNNGTVNANEGSTSTNVTTNNKVVAIYGESSVTVNNVGDDAKVAVAPGVSIPSGVGADDVVSIESISDSFGMSQDLESDYTVKSSAFLANDLTIPEGVTLTIDGTLSLNGKKLFVEGTLAVGKKGVITDISGSTGAIVLSKTGAIVNEGIIGKDSTVKVEDKNDTPKTVSMKNVIGLSFGLTKEIGNDGPTYTLTVSGEAVKKGDAPTLAITGAYVSDLVVKDIEVKMVGVTVLKDGAVSIGSKGTINVDGVFILKTGVTMDVDGIIKNFNASGDKVVMCNGTTVVINGSAQDVIIEANTGTIETYDNDGKRVIIDEIISTLSGDDIKSSSITLGNLNGITIEITSKSFTKEVNEEDVPYIEQMMNVYGTAAFADKDKDKDGIESVGDPSGDITVVGNVYIPAGSELILGEDMNLVTSDDTDVVITVGLMKTLEDADNNYKGSKYVIEATTETGSPYEVFYYTNFDDAYAAIATADDMTIYIAGGYEFTKEYTIAAEQSVEVASGDAGIYTISKDGKITVEEDGSLFDGFLVADSTASPAVTAGIKGILIVMDDATCIPAPGSYEVSSKDADNNMTYTSAELAIANAQAGETIYITDDVTFEDKTTIPEGVTVEIANGAIVTAEDDLIVDGKLVNEGTVVVEATGADEKADLIVKGEIDNTAGVITVDGDATITGTFEGVLAASNINAAKYYDGENDVYTSIASAVADCAEMDVIADVNVTGKVSESSDVVLAEGQKLIIDGEVVLKSVRLDVGSNLTVNGKLTADVIAATGVMDTTGALADSVVSVKEIEDVEFDVKKNDAKNTVTMYMDVTTPGTMKGTTTVTAGSVQLDAELTVSKTNVMKVSEGATLVVMENITAGSNDSKYFSNEGTMVINKAGVILNGINLGGTVAVADDVNVSLTNATVSGALTTGEDASVTVTDVMYVGSKPTTLGAAGTVNADVSFGTNAYVVVFDGSTFTNTDADVKMDSTAYTINDIAFATVYVAEGNTAVDVNKVNSIVYGLSDLVSYVDTNENGKYDDGETSNVTWKSGSNTANYVGQYDAVNADIGYAKVPITLSAAPGLIVYIDDIQYDAQNNEYTIGTHTITIYLEKGYEGTPVVKLNGTEITDGKLVITTDMMDLEQNLLSVTGATVMQDQPVVIQPSDSEKDGMELTDILLIVLVVLIVIMAIIVALRMMRS